jgi:phosphatidylglycerophosphate synthase
MLTIAIARQEHRELLRDAVAGILAVALCIVSISLVAAASLHLSGAYVLKVFLLFIPGAALVLLALPGSHRFIRMGPANHTTLVRGAMVALLAGMLGEQGTRSSSTAAVIVSSTTMVLDGLDGWIARRSGMATQFGARFDMETDAAFVAVLSLLVWQADKAGAWVLLSGLMRYLFAGVVAMVPRLQRPVPASMRGKTIAVLQMIALVLALAPFCRQPLSQWVAAAGLMALVVSFCLDFIWLLRQPVGDAA